LEPNTVSMEKEKLTQHISRQLLSSHEFPHSWY